MTGSPGLLLAALVLAGTALWLTAADKQMSSIVEKSVGLRRGLQVDPGGTLESVCAASGQPKIKLGAVAMLNLNSGVNLVCHAEINHRRGQHQSSPAIGDSSWLPASCTSPAGRPRRLEPVRFRQIRVCCQQGKKPCVFAWRFFMKS